MSVQDTSIWNSAGTYFDHNLVRRNTTTEVVNLNPDPITREIRKTTQSAFIVVMCGVVSVLGMAGNIINIIVFVRQGFKDSINISLLGLAIADLACVVSMFWSSVSLNHLFGPSLLSFSSEDFMYYTGAWPHACFNRITSFITTFITVERCLCVTLPLKVKNIISPIRTKIIIGAIFIAMFAVFAPFYFVNSLEWRFNPVWNRTMMSFVFAKDKEIVDTVTFPIHSVGLSAISFILVLLSTIILVIKLNQKTKWRQSAASNAAINQEPTSLRDKKVVKMVSFISTIFVVCFLPGTCIFFMMAYNPEFNFGRRYENSFCVLWCIAFFLETVNSSVNIIVYIRMSSKFRATLTELFCCRLKS